MAKTLNKLPASMAIQRGLTISDGIFFNVMEDGSTTPLMVVHHGIRGTQNVNKEDGASKNPANVQETESAKTHQDAKKTLIKFELRAAPLFNALTMCAEPGEGKAGRELGSAMRKIIGNFIDNSLAGDAIRQIGLRYARNILNGRWLWRNRSYAQGIEIRAFEISGKNISEIARSDAFKVPLGHFDNPTPEEEAIAKILVQGWAGEEMAPGIRVEATVDFGIQGAIEVYPSQNYVSKEKGFARSLYKHILRDATTINSGNKVLGQAALRDQKIGNALRTFDTWYQDFEAQGVVSPIEPMGANLVVGDFLRGRQESAFDLLKDIDTIDPTSNEGLFLLAILIRGGVFGEKTKGEPDDDNKKNGKKKDTKGKGDEA